MANDFRVVDYSEGTVVALPNVGFADVTFYTDPNGAAVAGITRFNLAPVVALPYNMETDGRVVFDASSNANPGLSYLIPVADLDNQGRT